MNLVYFTTTRILNRRQARWLNFLADYNFKTIFCLRDQHGKADTLSQRLEFEIRPGDAGYTQQSHFLMQPDQVQLFATYTLIDESLLNTIVEDTSTNGFEVQDRFLFRNNLIYVPDGPCRLRTIKECHDDALAGHFSVVKTLELISRSFWWLQPWKLVNEFVRTCDTCTPTKSTHHCPYSMLQPLPNPIRPWASISTDFITDLPETNGFNSILVVVDRFTKMAHFIPCVKAISRVETMDMLLTNIVRLHGLPDEIISDRGPQFISTFWKCLFQTLGTSTKISTAFHPETDKQKKRLNQNLEQYL